MSHVATVEVEIKDLKILEKVCKKLGHPVKIAAKGETITERLFGSQTRSGDASLKPQSFKYPIVVDSGKGEAYMDTYGGKRNCIDDWHQVQQGYSTELSVREMQNRGYVIQRKVLQDGSVELNCSC